MDETEQPQQDATPAPAADTAPQQDTAPAADTDTTPVLDAVGIPEEAIARAFDEIRALLKGLENPTWMLEAAKQQLELSATNVFRHIQQAV